MNGILIASGQTFVIDAMVDYITNNVSGLYVGLMTTTGLPSESAQLGAGLTEITGSGYTRQASSTWTKIQTGVDPIIQGSSVSFVVPTGVTWYSVNGYFVSLSSGSADALWSEEFSTANKGDRTQGDTWNLTPRYEQRYYGE
jgi:hypothetical protein